MSVFLLALAIGQETISTDARLSKPNNIDAALVPIQTFLKNASDATGVIFTAAPSIKNLKVDVFVDNKSVGETLSNLAEACGLQWVKGGAGYELIENPEYSEEVRQHLVAEDKLADKLLMRKINVYQLIAKLVPASDERWRDASRFASFKPDLEKAIKDLDAAKGQNLPDDQIEDLTVRVEALKEIVSGDPNLSLARLFSQLSLTDIEAYRTGTPYLATDAPDSQFILSTGDIAPSEIPGRHYMFTYVEPETRRIGYKRLDFHENQMSIGGDSAGRYPFDDVPSDLTNDGLISDLNGWDQTNDLRTVFTLPLDSKLGKSVAWDSQWFGKRFRLGDHLRWFHFATGVPIVAPAYRIVHPFMKLTRKADSQGAYLTSLIHACKGYAHKNGDFLQVRDGLFWRKQKNEIPEETMQWYESEFRYREPIASGQFANKITPLQASLIEDREGFAVAFNRRDFEEAYPAFKFISSLSFQQLSATNESNGIGYTTLNSAQQKAYVKAIVRGIADRGWVDQKLLDELAVNGFGSQSIATMSFRFTSMKMRAIYQSEMINDDGEQIESIPAQDQISKTVLYEFGSNGFGKIRFLSRLPPPFGD